MTSQEKADRLAAQLRENLRKRKAQARAASSSAPVKAGGQGASDEAGKEGN